MKFSTLVALVATASATCETSADCIGAFEDEESCCGQLLVAGLPDVEEPNYGFFKSVIWGLEDDEEMTVGHTAELCLPRSYIQQHAISEGESDGAMNAWDNLQDVLDSVPDADVLY